MNYSRHMKFFSKGVFGIKFILLVSIGSSKFSVAGKMFLFNAIIENIDSTLPLRLADDLWKTLLN